jgi:hypothetical protein
MKPTSKLMKRLSLYLFLILFTLQTPSQADDIRDFQLNGMSIGDSALKYFDKAKIEKNKMMHWYKNKKVTPVSIKVDGHNYDTLSFSYWTNDKNYTIIEITGMKNYRDNVDQCYKQKKDQIKIIEESFLGLRKKSTIDKHPADKSGKSKVDKTSFKFKSGGFIKIACFDWSEKMNYKDHFRMGILSAEFDEWLKIAYK